MALVDHDQGVVFIRQVADLVQGGQQAIHGEYPVGDDDLMAGVVRVGLFELLLQGLHIPVVIAVPLCFAKPDPVDDRGVVQCIGDDRVLRPEQGLKDPSICVEAGSV